MTPPPTSDAENATFSRKCYSSITQRGRRGHDRALQSGKTLRFLVVIVTWFLSTGGLPHQSADWFAMTDNFGREATNTNFPVCGFKPIYPFLSTVRILFSMAQYRRQGNTLSTRNPSCAALILDCFTMFHLKQWNVLSRV